MATKQAVKEVEKLNRKALAKGPTDKKAPAAPKTAEKTPTPKTKAPAEKKGPSASTIAHRRLLIAVSAIVKYGTSEQMTAGANAIADLACKVSEGKEPNLRAYLTEAPSRLLPNAYDQWRKNGTAQKGVLG